MVVSSGCIGGGVVMVVKVVVRDGEALYSVCQIQGLGMRLDE